MSVPCDLTWHREEEQNCGVRLTKGTVQPPIEDTPIENKPPNKGQTKSTVVCAKEDRLSTKDKKLGPKYVHYLEV